MKTGLKTTARLSALFAMLLGLPMLGVWAAGLPVGRYLEFPPLTRYVGPAPFSWIAFAGYALFALAWVVPVVGHAVRAWRRAAGNAPPSGRARRCFPWWGWAGAGLGAVSWVLAWTRFPWFAPLQQLTFTPLWLSYILVINALTWRRTGRCMMLGRTRYFLLLFPMSAGFWWFFEYLNRFVQNWYYVGLRFTPWEYFRYATLSFATVLPAVLGTREWLRSFAVFDAGFERYRPLSFPRPRLTAGLLLLITAAGLGFIGVEPNYLFPLLWISPLLIIVCCQALLGEPHLFSPLARGDWRIVVSSAVAALICGLFWEMWNYHSLAQWNYAVPFLQRFRIFEMPLIGYAGYLPFGMECAVIGAMLEPRS